MQFFFNVQSPLGLPVAFPFPSFLKQHNHFLLFFNSFSLVSLCFLLKLCISLPLYSPLPVQLDRQAKISC